MTDDIFNISLMQGISVLVTSGLLVAILRKAGFDWGRSMLGLAPVAGALVHTMVLVTGIAGMGQAIGLSLIIGALPLLLLAFGRWPRLAAGSSPVETFQ